MSYIVMNWWNVVVTVSEDEQQAKRAARACNGYIVYRSRK